METSTSGELTEFLQAQMLKYQTSQLVGVRPDEFRKDIEAFLHMNDADMEEFIDSKKQRTSPSSSIGGTTMTLEIFVWKGACRIGISSRWHIS